MNRRKPFRGQDYLLAANRLALSASLGSFLGQLHARRLPGTALGLDRNKALKRHSRAAPKDRSKGEAISPAGSAFDR